MTDSSRLTIYLQDTERAAVNRKAKREACSAAYVIRMLIREYLPEYDKIVEERGREV